MAKSGKAIRERLHSLEQHLKQENPVLVTAVQSFRTLDQVGYSTGLLDHEESFATQIPWWPMISVLGTFSAGKSTFINHYLNHSLQSTGNQAVDDKFTVICYSREPDARSLPGIALDADPRFPFYQISTELEKVAHGDGGRIDAYLQLKTCPCEHLRGMIIIDSPGFDADSQRNATLRLTDHIISLSDLVLVFFDARHPEPGAMRDTLKHLVSDTIHRSDSSKFAYILNQMDTTAREDNPEDVIGAWQRALAQEGLTAGRFYSIYNPEVAVPIDDEARRQRYETKRDHDLDEIHERIRQVSVERAYRIVGSLEKTAIDIQDKVIPRLREYKRSWRKFVLWSDAVLYSLVAAIVITGMVATGLWDIVLASPVWSFIAAVLVVVVFAFLHFRSRRFGARHIVKKIRKEFPPGPEQNRMTRAFVKNTHAWHSILSQEPVGWGHISRKRLQNVRTDTNRYIQLLNDKFTDPSGELGQFENRTPVSATQVKAGSGADSS